jgi:hypothetical protein
MQQSSGQTPKNSKRIILSATLRLKNTHKEGQGGLADTITAITSEEEERLAGLLAYGSPPSDILTLGMWEFALYQQG